MKYEITQSTEDASHWNVESVNGNGDVEIAVFSGPDAKADAEWYVSWKSKSPPALPDPWWFEERGLPMPSWR